MSTSPPSRFERLTHLKPPALPGDIYQGDPVNTRSIYTVGLYDDPTDGRIFHHAEAANLRRGQSVLVLANGYENAEVSLCSGSRVVTTEVLREAKTVLEF